MFEKKIISKSADIKREDRTVSEFDSWKYLRNMIFMGMAFIGLAGFKVVLFLESVSLMQNIAFYLSFLGMVLLIAGAGFCTGGLLGLLFGIPRSAQTASQDAARTSKIIRQNDNLVEISDWITKIIVGVGLTQIYRIPSALQSLGAYLSRCFVNGNIPDADQSTAGIIGVVTVLYFISIGFLAGYLWTRLNFTTMLAKNQNALESLEKELADKEKKLEVKKKEVDALSTEFLPQLKEMKEQLYTTSKDIEQSDPNKNQFGGQPESNGRKVTAVVEPTSFDPDFFTVTLTVNSISAEPLVGEVVFHLHPTYKKEVERTTVVNGVAKLNLLAWGAFTVGVVCDDGKTKLEMDLAELPGAPDKFKSR